MDTTYPHEVVYWDKGTEQVMSRGIIREEPLSIRVQGEPYSVVMRTPGDEKAHTAGFCLAEGLIETPDDYTHIAVCDGAETNVATITLTDQRRKQIKPLLERRGFVSQTSCGICGKELAQDLVQITQRIPDGPPIDLNAAYRRLDNLKDHQPLYRRTRAAHAAAIFDRALEVLSIAEDVGRHNALDKAVGKLFIDRRLDRAALLVLSSRISYELVQKAARARIPVILAASRPTGLAIDMAVRLNITLATMAKKSGLYVFSAPHRILKSTATA